MASKSGTSSQIISLPQGGGALQGIGEKFSPDLHTGTGNFTVPIALPPGRNGFQPQLNLVYSTGNGNGTFGLGWVLSIPGVSRKTSEGIPRYRDNARRQADRDTFILSGAEDLVPVQEETMFTRYRPRTEGLFARIIHYHDTQNNHWEVHSKDGLTSLYGTLGSTGNDPAVIGDPENRSKVFSWKLTETRDPFNNRIVYAYERDLNQTGLRQWDQLYLRQIRYVDYNDVGGNEHFLVTVALEYESRPDEFSDCRAGFDICTRRRCRSIIVRTEAGTVHSYEFTYQEDAYNGISLLRQVKVVGHDNAGDRVEELPPLEFGYTRFEPEKRDFFPVTGADMPPGSLAQPDYELADLFGNGLPDVLQMNGSVRYWRNLGDGRFDIPREMREAPAGLHLADPGVQLVDADGDGRIDLLALQNGIAGYFPLRFGGMWDRRSLTRYSAIPSFNLEDPEVKLVDLDGDGVTDILRSGTSLECYFNHKDPKLAWRRTRRLERQRLEAFPNVNFSDPRVKWGDMNGDDLQDIVLVSDGNVEYWPNLGHGNWGRRVSMRGSPRFPYGYDPHRILLGDVDGDGVDDLVYVDSQRVMVWINQSGSGWSATPIVIAGTPPVSDMDAVRLVDLLGTGVAGLLWSMDAGGLTRETMYFLDFTGGVKPNLLNVMDNHLGSVTQVKYAPSTRFYLEDEQQPGTRWKTPLPFPVQVVARVEVFDAISDGKLTTEYRYHHGYWDGAEREFRGFGMVEQFDSETFRDFNDGSEIFEKIEDRTHFSPPTCTRTWFHQGPVGDEFGEWEEVDYSGEFWPDDPSTLSRPRPMRIILNRLPRRAKRDALRTLQGSVLRTELYALDGSERQERPYTVTEQLYSVREEDPLNPESDRSRIFFPHLLAQRTTQWERGDDPMTQFAFSDDYDAFGQPHQQTVVALPRRAAKRQPFTGAVVGQVQPNETRILATHTRTAYAAPDGDVYIHDRVAHVRTFELVNPPVVNETDSGDLRQVLRDQAAAAEEVLDEFRVLLDGWQAGDSLPGDVRLVGHTVNHYDGAAFLGRDPGEVGLYGALTRSETLVFTDDELDAAYDNHRPSYLGGTANLPVGAPTNFGSDFGYRLATDSSDGYHSGYYADAQRRQFDFQSGGALQNRGVVSATRDALGNQTTIQPDMYWLLPALVTDSVGLETRAVYNYRVMQPERVTDTNGHTTLFRYTALGLLQKRFLQDRDGAGGTEERPEMKFTYDFLGYERTRSDEWPQPIFVHSRQRVWHASDNVSDDVIESREYADGFGRLIQKCTQAEVLTFGANGDDVGLPPQPGSPPGPAVGQRDPNRVVVSGWQVYDNKGRVIEKYEPFFSSGFDYRPHPRVGAHTTLYYDPRGQVIRIVNPDGSEQRVIYGILLDLQTPEDFAPTPWEAYTYDPNDLAPSSHDANGNSLVRHAPVAHHYTPTSTVLNAQGKVICQVERNGDAVTDWYITRSTYDVRGNLLTVWDARGRQAFKHAYDLLNKPLRVDSMDAGIRTSVLDAAGNLVESRDSKDSLMLREYDALNRLFRLWARDGANTALTMREVLIYGDQPAAGLTRAAALAGNLLGRLYRHYDEAGVQQVQAYDFKGNPADKIRRVIGDAVLAAGWTSDWGAAGANNALDNTPYQTTTRYDALNRPVEIVYPAGVNGQRAVLEPAYNRAGALEQVELDGTPYVSQIAYNSKGQRVLIAYANGVMTRYRYDTETFQLVRLRTERFALAGVDTWSGVGAPPHQDFTYRYDLVGNIVSIEERTPGCGITNNLNGRDRLVRTFTYDPLYRLTSADGRACRNIGAPRPFDDLLPCGSYRSGVPNSNQNNAPDLTERYTETYEYDPAGNLLKLIYAVPNNPSHNWTRQYDYDLANNNRLASLTQNGATYSYTYDDNGNLTQQATERRHTWDHAGRMTSYVNQAGVTPSVEARYLYGADGMRVKKWTHRNGAASTGESTVYVDDVFEHHRWSENGASRENNHLHVMDNQSRIVMVRRGPAHPEDAGPAVRYHLGDHLDSSHVLIDDGGSWVNREEYTPYGETSFGGFARKRYRFTGKERDMESGLYYHGARYYAPWFARWVSCDPAGPIDGLNLYIYCACNPFILVDPTGKTSNDINGTPQDAGVKETSVPRGSYGGFFETDPIGGTTETIGPAPAMQVDYERLKLMEEAERSGFTTLSSIAYSDLGCWGYEKAKPSTPRSEP